MEKTSFTHQTNTRGNGDGDLEKGQPVDLEPKGPIWKRTSFKVWMVIILMSFGLRFCFVYFEYPIDYAFEGVRFIVGEETYETVSVEITGSYQMSLFKDDYTKIKIKINDEVYPSTENRTNVSFEQKYPVSSQFGSHSLKPTEYFENYYTERGILEWISLDYNYYKNDRFKHRSFANLFISDDRQVIAIGFPNFKSGGSSWSSTPGYEIIISAPSIEAAKACVHESLGWPVDEW